ncbi:MAG: hypothetical protein R3A52_14325 [Polyangiales bacterium]
MAAGAGSCSASRWRRRRRGRAALTLGHMGAVLDTRGRQGLLGAVVVVIEDDRFLPTGAVTNTLAPDALAAIAEAEFDLAWLLARALRGERDALRAVDTTWDRVGSVPTLRFALEAWATLHANPTCAPAAAARASTARACAPCSTRRPIVPTWDPSGAVVRSTPAALRARRPRGAPACRTWAPSPTA